MDSGSTIHHEEQKLYAVFLLFVGLMASSICYKLFKEWLRTRRNLSNHDDEEPLPPYSSIAKD
jgi:hypothetical protein